MKKKWKMEIYGMKQREEHGGTRTEEVEKGGMEDGKEEARRDESRTEERETGSVLGQATREEEKRKRSCE